MESLEAHILNFNEYEYWYEALRNDDMEVISKELNTRDVNHRARLLNGTFNLDEIEKESRNKQMQRFAARDTWHMVVTLCSKETIRLFISKGVNLHTKNDQNYNFVHNMILTAAYQPQSEDKMIQKYIFIMDNIGKSDKYKLLMDENDDGMRPLEFAMNIATTGMFQGKVF